jgi:O-antigen biosynthesis protein
MKLSIITPTHNTRYLEELEESIKANTFQDWEWIILLNNGAKYTSKDTRVKIHKSKTNTTKVGALKKEACSFNNRRCYC